MAPPGWSQLNILERLAKKPIRAFTMRKLMNNTYSSPTALALNAEWLREEMTVRYAHRLRDFNRQPHIVVANPNISEVYEMYWSAFDRLLNFQAVRTVEDEKRFTEMISSVVKEQGGVVDFMQRGVHDLKIACPDMCDGLDDFLNRLFVSRISRRVMLEHHIALHSPREDFAGVVALNCKPADILAQVSEEVRGICGQTLGIAPRVSLSGNMETTFVFIPEHLRVIVYEILKNAMRATVEFCCQNKTLDSLPVADDDVPEVRIELFKGQSDVIIKISDKGGGILPQRLNKIWSYGYTTLEESTDSHANSRLRSSELAGFGFGLPLSRAYAQYFGGDIHLQAMLGHGTDTYINLNHVGDLVEAVAEFSNSTPATSSTLPSQI